MNFVDHSYRPIMLLVLESGAVYSATLTTLLILYKTGSWFQYVLLDAVRPLPLSPPSLTRATIRLLLTTSPRTRSRP